MTLKDAIIRYRAVNNVSMRDFAAKCGVSMQTIYNIEAVGQNPSRITREKIKMVLGDEYEIDKEEE
jgi:transcriptional regulator with XRE-family HTH domain